MINTLDIVHSAINLGYDKCGIIPVSMMDGYEERLEERMRRYPKTKEKLEGFLHLRIRSRSIKVVFSIKAANAACKFLKITI